MNVLVCCEESQVVCSAFRSRGHNAFSCDLRRCTGHHPEWHIRCDALACLGKNVAFRTCDGKLHFVFQWDMIIAHPPCTYLSAAGSNQLYPRPGVIDENRYALGVAAREFFMRFYDFDCDRICVENPRPCRVFCLPERSQVIEPYFFGDPYTKRTYLWLKGLPLLQSTDLCSPVCSWTALHFSASVRSKTFPGVAAAMVEQWG